MAKVKYFIYILIQCTWGGMQTLLGFLMFIRFGNCEHSFYHGCIKTTYNNRYSLSLGMFIFVSQGCKQEITLHEYGHTIQSLILGPLYLPIVGITSYIWCRLPYFQKMRKQRKIPYSYFWIEKWADMLGKLVA